MLQVLCILSALAVRDFAQAAPDWPTTRWGCGTAMQLADGPMVLLIRRRMLFCRLYCYLSLQFRVSPEQLRQQGQQAAVTHAMLECCCHVTHGSRPTSHINPGSCLCNLPVYSKD
ncbi:hypothetical protein IG631_03119 [Alternaria alternata]|nr:hypothetical protein IG631_03119 [Alternaria alternata]